MLLIIKIISVLLFLSVFSLPLDAKKTGAYCSPAISISDLQDIACSIKELRKKMREDNLLRAMANVNFFVSADPAGQQTVASLSASNPEVKNKVEQYHKRQRNTDYTIVISAYPSSVKSGSCSKKYQTIDIVGGAYRSSSSNFPRSFEMRYNPNRDKFFICENTTLSRQERMSTVCKGNEDCKKQLFVSCQSADRAGAVTVDKKCMSIDQYENLSKELFLGRGWFSFSNPALEATCPDGCSYYTQTVQRVYKRGRGSCSENYINVHCGPKKMNERYNLDIQTMANLCDGFGNSFNCP